MSRFIYCDAECHYTECHYAECRGAIIRTYRGHKVNKKIQEKNDGIINSVKLFIFIE